MDLRPTRRTDQKLFSPTRLHTINHYVKEFSPKLVVLALGANDARILQRESRLEGGYRPEYFKRNVRSVLTDVLAEPNACALIVNVAVHWQPEFTSHILTVNKITQEIVAEKRGRTAIADWHSHSSDAFRLVQSSNEYPQHAERHAGLPELYRRVRQAISRK